MNMQSISHTKILYVGPAAFNPNTWRTRAEYILPDLFSSLGEGVELHLITGDVPEFAVEPLLFLCKRFAVHHNEIGIKRDSESRVAHWRRVVSEVACSVKPVVITNSFGAQWMGEVIGHAAARSGARAVIRVAGDEIGSRQALGMYKDEQQKETDLAAERAGFLGADTIIAMSPWEKARIEGIPGVAKDNVKICIRGVDLSRFAPAANAAAQKRAKRFLYVGRKSAEKGYDIIEAAAKKVYQEDPEIQFVFVGDFEPEKVENRHYLGWVEAADLPALYRSVDAFVLTSRSEGFPQVVAEAMATGLPCIVSEHLFSTVFRHEEDALLTALMPEAVVQQILRLTHDIDLTARLARRSREIAETSLDMNLWNQCYASIILGQPVQFETIFERAHDNQISKLTNSTGLPRIAFISPRVFGMMGTQGSYGLARAFSEMTPTMVISRKSLSQGALPIVANDTGLSRHHRINFASPGVAEEIAKLLSAFKPDIVHYVNDHSWIEIIPFLKSRYPIAKYIMDFKTPLMAEGEKRWWLQTSGSMQARKLDMAVALSKDIARSWIPEYAGPLLVSPLGICVANIKRRRGKVPKDQTRVRFVYVGQLHPKRKLSQLLQMVASLSEALKAQFAMDIYGAGGGENEIDALIGKLGLTDIVARKASLPQEQLFSVLPEYDYGVAWVPNEFYGQAPSLKFLEYAAAGLGIIATDTPAHRRNIQDGFYGVLFAETPESFMNAVEKAISGESFEPQIENNFSVVQRFDFGWIVQKILLPAYVRLMEGNAPDCEVGMQNMRHKLRAHEMALHAKRVAKRMNMGNGKGVYEK
jgi:glycosyltransferase involved in cell wall biosynthesis